MSVPRALLASLLLLGFGCGRDPNKVKVAYVERGNEYFKNGKYKEASIMYRSALKKDLRYGEAYYRLGLAELRLGRIVDAVRSLRRAVELQPDNLDAATKLSDIYLQVYLQDPKRPKEALQELESIATPLLKKNPNSFLGLRIKGHLALAANNISEALAAFEAANKVQPLAKEISLPLLQALRASKRSEEAEKLAYQMIDKDKTFAAVYDWLYFYYVSQNRLAEAEKTYVLKFQNNPKQPFFLLQLAAHYLLTNQRPKMEQTLERLTSNPRDFPLGWAQAGDFYLRARDIDNAVKHYEEGLRRETNAEQKALYEKRIVETMVLRGQRREALERISKLVKENPKDYEAVAIRSSLLVLDGSKENVASAISELNAILTRNPENFYLRYNLGRAYVARGDIEQARIQFNEAIKYQPRYTPARLALAQLHLARNEFTKALQAAEDILSYDAANIQARMIRTSCRMGLGDLPTARKELEVALAAQPNFPDALFQMGLLNFQEKRYKDAEQHFLRLQKVAPNDPRGLVGMVETLAGQKRFDEAVRMLEDSIAGHPERSFYRLTLANIAARAGKYDLALGHFRQLLDKNPRNFDVQLRIAEVYRLKADIPNAIEAFKKAKELNPNDPTAYVRLALLYEERGQRAEARPLYEQLLKIEPDNPLALNNLAYLIAESGGDLDLALTMAQRARAKLPQVPEVADTLGWIYVKKKLNEPAIQIFRELVAKHEKNSIFRYHLAVALLQKGDKPSARRECEIALKLNPPAEDAAKIKELLSRI